MQQCRNTKIQKYKVEIEKWKVINRESTESKAQNLRNQKNKALF